MGYIGADRDLQGSVSLKKRAPFGDPIDKKYDILGSRPGSSISGNPTIRLLHIFLC